jgi:hypothetical protein
MYQKLLRLALILSARRAVKEEVHFFNSLIDSLKFIMLNLGHTGDVATSILIPKVVDLCRNHKSKLHGGPIHVVAAGGIFDGRGLAMSLWYACDVFTTIHVLINRILFVHMCD